MAKKEVNEATQKGPSQGNGVPWADCGAVTKSGNGNMEPSRHHWTCHCRCRPKERFALAMERDER